MASKLVILTALTSLALVHGAKLSTTENTEVISKEKEGRLLEVPLLGLLIWKVTKIGWLVVSKVFKVIGWKLAAVTLAASIAIKGFFWVYANFLSLAVGAICILGFCKLTNKCSLHHLPSGLAQVGEELYYAAKNLESGITLYEDK